VTGRIPSGGLAHSLVIGQSERENQRAMEAQFHKSAGRGIFLAPWPGDRNTATSTFNHLAHRVVRLKLRTLRPSNRATQECCQETESAGCTKASARRRRARRPAKKAGKPP